MGAAETLTLPLGDGWVLCQPDMDRLAVLNATGNDRLGSVGRRLWKPRDRVRLRTAFWPPGRKGLVDYRGDWWKHATFLVRAGRIERRR
jgi:hypothetical protein